MNQSKLDEDKVEDLMGKGYLFARDRIEGENEIRKKNMKENYKMNRTLKKKTKIAALPSEIRRDLERNSLGKEMIKMLDKMQYRIQDLQTLNAYLLEAIDQYVPTIMDADNEETCKSMTIELYDEVFGIVGTIQNTLNHTGNLFYQTYREKLVKAANRGVDTAFMHRQKERATVMSKSESTKWHKAKKEKSSKNAYRRFSQKGGGRERFKNPSRTYQGRSSFQSRSKPEWKPKTNYGEKKPGSWKK